MVGKQLVVGKVEPTKEKLVGKFRNVIISWRGMHIIASWLKLSILVRVNGKTHRAI